MKGGMTARHDALCGASYMHQNRMGCPAKGGVHMPCGGTAGTAGRQVCCRQTCHRHYAAAAAARGSGRVQQKGCGGEEGGVLWGAARARTHTLSLMPVVHKRRLQPDKHNRAGTGGGSSPLQE